MIDHLGGYLLTQDKFQPLLLNVTNVWELDWNTQFQDRRVDKYVVLHTNKILQNTILRCNATLKPPVCKAKNMRVVYL